MFNFFKSRQDRIEDLMNAIKDAGYVQPVKAPEQSMIAYQVGKTEDGKVTLQMGGTYGSTTCTMDNAGVRQLIRMLESAMEDEEVTE